MIKILYTGLWLLSATTVWACPACISAGNQKYFIQNAIAVTVMCVVPLVVVGFVIWRIRRIQGYGRHQG